MTVAASAGALPQLVLAARERLRPYVRNTPCEPSAAYSRRFGAEVWFKGEHLQHTRSFKARGAMHKLLCLSPSQRSAGVVTASSGNHGAGVAWAGHTLGVPALVFVPEFASAAKVAMILGYGAEVQRFGVDGLDTELHARQVAAERGLAYVSPYNDWEIVAGQGTVAVELLERMERLGTVIVAVGGGGLIGGMAAYLKHELPNVRVIGAQPENSAVMTHSVAAGRILELDSRPTLSDGTAGGVEPGSVTFELCRDLVDEWVLVSEEEIAVAMRHFLATEQQRIEGAAAVALAALDKSTRELRGERSAVVLCGGNVSEETLQQILPDQRGGAH